MTTRDDHHMSSTRLYEHRAAIKRLTALAAQAEAKRIAALRPFIEFHEQQIAALEAAEQPVTYPGGPDIRIDPPYDR